MIDAQYRRLFDLVASPVRKLLFMPSREIIPVCSYIYVQLHGVGAGRASGKVLPHVAVMKGEI
jgi:hypothetical protein